MQPSPDTLPIIDSWRKADQVTWPQTAISWHGSNLQALASQVGHIKSGRPTLKLMVWIQIQLDQFIINAVDLKQGNNGLEGTTGYQRAQKATRGHYR